MFKALRITVLLYVLLFAVVGQLVSGHDSTNWDDPLWVEAYPVNGDGSEAAGAYIEQLHADDLDAVEAFFANEAERFGVPLDAPLRIVLAPEISASLPQVPRDGSVLDALLWSLRMRWLTTKLGWQSDRPTPDIVLYLVYHDAVATPVVDRSVGLRRGLIAVANVFADREASGGNHVVIAHELMHTLGATDKYDPATNLPLFPAGFADPDARPRLPQRHAEIMAGRIPTSKHEATFPGSLDRVRVGATTAAEIRWRSMP